VTWTPAGPERFRLYEGAPGSPAVAESGLSALPTPSEGAAAQVATFSRENPLLAFGALAALTFGLMAFSTSGTVRVGKTKVTGGLGIGDTK
jgi:hypothetical protein